MKKSLQTHNRPMIILGVYFILGIIGGSIRNNVSYAPLFCIVTLISIGVVIVTRNDKSFMWLFLVFILGIGRVIMDPIAYESKQQEEGVILGRVRAKESTAYGDVIIIDRIQKQHNGEVEKYFSSIKVEGVEQMDVSIGDRIRLRGEVITVRPQMNPSDMNYELYLKSRGISKVMRASSMEKVGTYWMPFEVCRQKLIEQIQHIFGGKDQGIITCLLLGEDKFMEETIEKMYYTLGIGHVLVISGAHIGILFGIVWWLISFMPIGYKGRIMGSLIAVWGYGWMVGYGVSTLRACIVLTVIYVGRMLWEEEDLWISLMSAALIILWINPYQLFQAGFQLSFMAYIGVILSIQIIQYCKVMYHLCTRKHALSVALITQGLITLGIVPVLSWHFFEVPFLGTLLNLLIVPLFAILLPLCLGIVAMSFFTLTGAKIIGEVVIFILTGINKLVEWSMGIPYATLITGRPQFVTLMLMYGCFFCFIIGIYNKRYRDKLCLGGMVCIGIWMGLNGIKKPLLEITHLYVGQGDSSVIQTPNGKVIIIDGGPTTQAYTLEKFLKYKGIRKVDLVIVSHAHEDHIGGIIGLIEGNIPIDYVMMPKMLADDKWEQILDTLCERKQIPYKSMEKEMKIKIGEVEIVCSIPTFKTEDTNERSVGCLVQFGSYKEFFTGDMSMRGESKLELPVITVLKVAHHGSNTSSSDKFLKQIQPKYGMISCGIHNRYNHPNTYVMERFQTNHIETLRTDQRGAISFITDGIKLKVVTHIQEDKKSDSGEPMDKRLEKMLLTLR